MNNEYNYKNSRVSEPTIIMESESNKPKRPKINVLPLFLGILIIVISFFSIKQFISNKKETSKNNENKIAKTITFGDSIKITGTGATSSNGVVTIKDGGTYKISGKTSDGSIIVNAPSDNVVLNLSGVSIKSPKSAAIKIENANLVTININKQTDNYIEDESTSVDDASILSSANLIIDGTGNLVIQGSKANGITAKAKNITINSGNISIYSAATGMDAGGAITIEDGNLYVDAEGTGISSSNNIVINDGTLYVIGGSNQNVDSIYSGGSYQINGGTVLALGNGKIDTPSNTSSQNVMLFQFDSIISLENAITLTNENGDEIVSFMVARNINNITLSTPQLTNGIYNLYYDIKHDGEIHNKIYNNGNVVLGNKINIGSTSDYIINGIINTYSNQSNLSGETETKKDE